MSRLRVLAGSSLDTLVPISHLVNSNKPHHIRSEFFDGEIVAHIKGFTGTGGKVIESEYFTREDRHGITWSIQVQGRFLKSYSADDVLFGNTFDRPLHLPWGSNLALKFMKLIDPTLDHDLTSSTKPWALSPLIATMPHFAYTRIAYEGSSPYSSPDPFSPLRGGSPPFPPKLSLSDDTSQLHLALSSPSSSASSSSSSLISSHSSNSIRSRSSRTSLSSIASNRSGSPGKLSTSAFSLRKKRRASSKGRTLNLNGANQRRSHFSSAANRRQIVFGPDDVITTDFCYGFIEFSPSLSLKLPGGVSFDLNRYWDGQPVRFVCCERKDPSDHDGDPWGRVLWCVVVEPCDSPD